MTERSEASFPERIRQPTRTRLTYHSDKRLRRLSSPSPPLSLWVAGGAAGASAVGGGRKVRNPCRETDCMMPLMHGSAARNGERRTRRRRRQKQRRREGEGERQRAQRERAPSERERASAAPRRCEPNFQPFLRSDRLLIRKSERIKSHHHATYCEEAG